MISKRTTPVTNQNGSEIDDNLKEKAMNTGHPEGHDCAEWLSIQIPNDSAALRGGRVKTPKIRSSTARTADDSWGYLRNGATTSGASVVAVKVSIAAAIKSRRYARPLTACVCEAVRTAGRSSCLALVGLEALCRLADRRRAQDLCEADALEGNDPFGPIDGDGPGP